MTDLSILKKRLENYQPRIQRGSVKNQAAVSLILVERSKDVDLFFIQRAEHQNDPWSGQMAFPGGRRSSEDASSLSTAQRETLEEVGIKLSPEKVIGRLDDLIAPAGSPANGLIVSCHVFQIANRTTVAANSEVGDTMWIPLSSLTDPSNFLAKYRPVRYNGEFPGIRVSRNDDRVIWGLTYRLLCSFFETTGVS